MTQDTKDIIEIWTDGACKCNPGPGGWGALLRCGEKTLELCGGEAMTTNNRMELTAVIRALRSLKSTRPVILHLDSTYVKDGMTSWMPSWKRKHWKTAAGNPVKNIELWQELDAVVTALQEKGIALDWQWVKGHAGDPGNEQADALANRGVAPYL